MEFLSVEIKEDEIKSVREEFTKNRNNLAAIKESLRKTMENEFDDIIEEVCVYFYSVMTYPDNSV